VSGEKTNSGQLNRRGFLKNSAAAATGVAVAAAPAAAVMALDGRSGATASSQPAAVVTKPSGPAPAEPVMAYVRNAATSEVTVMSGTSETTYKDPVLTQRLLDAAGPTINGEGI
jgi:hypothetical protein